MQNDPLLTVLYFCTSLLCPAVGISFVIWLKRQPDRTGTPAAGRYQRAPSLLTNTEGRFYLVLREAVGPMAVIQCKVRLADVLHTAEGDLRSFRQVSQKHVDFLLCDPRGLQPLVGIELDDRSHQRRDRIKRDHFVDNAYASAGLPLVHIPTAAAYDPAQLLRLLQPHLTR